ncbi:hypothetical protein PN498_20855 [Oscillatoria sp. CS-180]|uniref:hypothetical protein n=1 Tax=Oscillatoria sp. CS-180 TaxID=3021720 RepID=UPI00232ED2ED|nr:hypothetical protein [Oscillatoria sp. CS-180]MDB9528454.1 hypothetical protein [Oscillatoria sp. CS-180]
MSSPILNLSPSIECPKCGKHTVVSDQVGVYRCLSCDFERNLSPGSLRKNKGGIGELVSAIAGFLIAAVLIL